MKKALKEKGKKPVNEKKELPDFLKKKVDEKKDKKSCPKCEDKETSCGCKEKNMKEWVDCLIKEGHDLSDYSWDEMKSIFEERLNEGGDHREADTGKVVDKPEIGKIYYPNQPLKKTSVAKRKEAEAAKKKVVKEDICEYLTTEGFANNPVSAEIMFNHMSDQWLEAIEEMYKGKHGQSEKEYQDGRSDAGKMISGDSKSSGANYTYRAKNTGPNPAGGSKKPQAQGRMTNDARADLNLRKNDFMKKAGYTSKK